MNEVLLIITTILLLTGVSLLIRLALAKGTDQNSVWKSDLLVLEKEFGKIENSVKDEITRNREEWNRQSKELREELNNSFKQFGDSVLQRMTEISGLQKSQLETFSTNLDKKISDFSDYQRQKFSDLAENQNKQAQASEQKLEKMRETVETRLKTLQDENSKKLDEMRATVDEKLQTTLEKRLGESFKQVSERLEQVHKGLGEMQTLATGVGDLKKVLSNVKTKGVLGEYQLGNLLEQLLTPEQYGTNVKTKEGSAALVEFAVKLPGRDNNAEYVWLPVDSKFPTEDYQMLLDAYDQGNIPMIEEKTKALANRIKLSAKEIRDKYLDPPHTTDFAIMFLPFEGLYAEVLRNIGLFETIQREYKIVITGPTTLSALLNSLQMGFRTLAIEKRSGEVWELLGAIKTQFSQFGDILQKTQKKLQDASNVIEQASTRSRVIERKLKAVQELPVNQSRKVLDQADEDETPIIEIAE
ncbi:MAG: DNA recombination protein RmuC [Bacteroidia bacterium]|nr:DNA recombination protein RmuC [Bacteroidia bacterium]